MEHRKFIGAKFVSYYNLLVSVCFVIGSLVLIGFSGNVDGGARAGTVIGLVFLALFGAFCGFAAIKYLRREKVGRVCLAVCFVAQILYSIHGLISTYRVTVSVSGIAVVMLIIGCWGTWYMTTDEAKEWISVKT